MICECNECKCIFTPKGVMIDGLIVYDSDELKLCPKCLKEFKDIYGQSCSYLTKEECRRIDKWVKEIKDMGLFD